MNYIEAIILGIVEGLTEFLPVSSTGHLILANDLLGVSGEMVETFDIFIQLGAILAVIFLFHERFAMLFKPNPAQRFSGLQGWKLLLITSLPAMVLGFLTHKYIKLYLFSPLTVILALAVVGAAIIIIEKVKLPVKTKSINDLTAKQALMVGVFQCFALWPGVSRSGSTIIGGMLAGLDRKLAAEYSFIAAVPIMFMATFYDLYKSMAFIQPTDYPIFAVGFLTALVSAIFAIKTFVRLLQRFTLVPFGVYRIALAIVYFFLIGV